MATQPQKRTSTAKTQRKAVIFVDAENISPASFNHIFDYCTSFGMVQAVHVCGRHDVPSVQAWIGLKLLGELIPPLTTHFLRGPHGKNASDVLLTLKVMEALSSSPDLDVVCLVTSDSDFSALITHLRALDKTVIGACSTSSPVLEHWLDDCLLLNEPAQLSVETLKKSLTEDQVHAFDFRLKFQPSEEQQPYFDGLLNFEKVLLQGPRRLPSVEFHKVFQTQFLDQIPSESSQSRVFSHLETPARRKVPVRKDFLKHFCPYVQREKGTPVEGDPYTFHINHNVLRYLVNLS